MRVVAPGRVNLIGDHVDYVGGVVLPMAVQLGTEIVVEPAPGDLRLSSADVEDESGWQRFVAATVREVAATGEAHGGTGRVSSTLPIGAGMSSSSSLTVAVALAAGFTGSPLELARLAQRAEIAATGVPCGLMDQLAITHGVDGHALRIDCRVDEVSPVPLPSGVAVHAIHSGVARRLEGSPYADRRRSCEAAEAEIGPLRDASLHAVDRIGDATIRSRARHVVSEIARVDAAVAAARADDAVTFGELMNASHVSLRDDFEVSIPELDDLVGRLQATPGVLGARLTGAGFGGCAVVLADAEADLSDFGGWSLRPSAAAAVQT